MARPITAEELKSRIEWGKGRPPKYPWEEWLREDLGAIELIPGEDFDCGVDSIRSQASRHARRLGFPGASVVALDGGASYAIRPTGPKDESKAQA